MIGEMIGSYRVLSQIGQGGMGAVYLAEHPLIGRKVAIKVILPEHSHQQDTLNRFFNEARATARLRHPSLVDTIDFGTHTNGSAYIIMEYLEGENLGARLKRVPIMAAWEAARLGRQIAEAVGVAHAAGIVHRDLKPDNVFLTPHPSTGDDLVKILDFGIAKLTGPEGSGTQTRTGVMVGTPLFMAPEQCRGSGQVDHRADVYSLGCILYRMLTGQPPFTHAGIGELIAAHLYETPPAPRELLPAIPEPFEAVILRALAKRPDDRYQTMTELIRDLDAASAALTADAYARAGGRTAVLPAVDGAPLTPLPPMTTSRRGISGAPVVATPVPGAPASPHAGLEGRTQVLPPTVAAPAVTGDSQRLRSKTTFSGASGSMEAAPAVTSLRPRGPGRLLIAGAVIGVAAVAALVLVPDRKPPSLSVVPAAAPTAEPPLARVEPPPRAPAPAAPSPPPPAAEKAPPPAPSPAEASRKAESAAKPAAAAPKTRTIRITVSNPPEELTVLIDGRPGKIPVRLPLDLKPHTLRFESARTRPEVVSITADRDQTLELANKPKMLIE
jgi:serine/threonine-protein kinase